MKKKLSLFLLALITGAGTLFASDTQVDGIWYDFDSSTQNASVTYRGYFGNSYSNEYSGSVVIPSSVTYNNVEYSVTSIGDDAFYNCSGLTSIEIPNSVTSIGNKAFEGCSWLASVTIPNSVTSIGNHAFDGCSGLTSLTIPNSVTSIGNYAFRGCTRLTSVTIPNSVTSIGDYAFYGCSGLTSIEIPNSVTSIGGWAFYNCSNLEVVYIDDLAAWCGIEFGNSYANPLYFAHNLRVNNKELTNLVIPNSVTSIGNHAFDGCSGLTSLTIPNSVTSIGNYAFRGCTGLTSIEIPNSVTSIGSYAFQNCSGLTSIEIPNSVTSIGEGAFNGCSGLTSVAINSNEIVSKESFIDIFGSQVTEYIIGEEVTSIGEWAFYDCSGLTSVMIPNSVTSIGDYAFYDCSGLTSVTIPNSVTSIGDYAFYGCSGLTSPVYNAHVFAFMPTSYSGAFTIPDGIESIAGGAFRGCTGLTSIEIPNSVTSIGRYAFYGCTGLTSIEIPNSVTSIGSRAFYGCTGLPIIDNVRYADSYLVEAVDNILSSHTIKEGTRFIGSYAFKGCKGLTSVTIPNSVTSIGDYAFSGCSGLTSVTIPNSVTSIGDDAFNNCISLTSVYISDIASWCAISFGNSSATPLYYAHNLYLNGTLITDLSIPNTVTSIGYSAFYGCTGLTSVTIPNSVTSIGDYAFDGCSSLTSVTIPNSITSIGSDAFYNVPNILYNGTATGSPWGARSLNGYVDGYLVYSDVSKTSLLACFAVAEEIIIPNSVTNIGGTAFSGCSHLSTVTIKADSILSKNYSSTSNLRNIFGGQVTEYILGDSVTSIGANAFYDCTNVESFDIPESITSIGTNAFYKVKNINYNGSATGAPWGALAMNNSPFVYTTTEIDSITSRLSSGQTSEQYYHFSGVISFINEVSTSYGNATFYVTDGTTTFYCYRIYDYYSTRFTSSEQLSVGDSVVISSKVQNYRGTTPEAVQGRLVYHSANPLFTPDSIIYYGIRRGYSDQLKLYTAIDTDTLNIPESVTYNGTTYTVTEMASGAIYNHQNLKCVVLPRTLQSMPRAFELCENIQTLYYNAEYLTKPTLTPFEASKQSLKHVYIGESVRRIPDDIFSNLENISTVHWYAIRCSDMEYSPFYYSRNNITSFTIADNIEKIPANLCYEVTAINELDIPSTVTQIGKDAFNGTNIREVTFPNSVQKVGNRAFANCPLEKVYWGVADQADYGEEDLYSAGVTVGLDASNLNWSTVYLYAWSNSDGEISSWPGDRVYRNEDGLYTYSIPSTYSTINIIWNNGTDQTVDITNVSTSAIYTLTSSIGKNISYNTRPFERKSLSPFVNSTANISEFAFGENVTRIPALICKGAGNLTELTIPNSVTAIGESAFDGCSALTTLTLGESITSYGENAFAGCSNLSSIYNYRERPAKLGAGTFDGVDYFNCTLYVLANSVNMYKSSGSDWKDFYFVEPIGATSATTDEVVVTPYDNTADIVWPTISGAASYELQIKNIDGNPICTLVFNANGQLTSLAFHAPSRNNAPQQTQTAGFQFTITGLDAATNYSYILEAKDASSQVIAEYIGTFGTTGAQEISTGVNTITTDSAPQKIMTNGQIYILRGEKTYTVTGQEVK